MVIHQLQVSLQTRESSPVRDQHSTSELYTTNFYWRINDEPICPSPQVRMWRHNAPSSRVVRDLVARMPELIAIGACAVIPRRDCVVDCQNSGEVRGRAEGGRSSGGLLLSQADYRPIETQWGGPWWRDDLDLDFRPHNTLYRPRDQSPLAAVNTPENQPKSVTRMA